MTSSENIPENAPADDVSIPEQFTEAVPYTLPEYVEFPTTSPLNPAVGIADIMARLDQLEAASNATFSVIGTMAQQVQWIGGTLNGILNSAAQMGGPGGKIMSMMLGGGKK